MMCLAHKLKNHLDLYAILIFYFLIFLFSILGKMHKPTRSGFEHENELLFSLGEAGFDIFVQLCNKLLCYLFNYVM